MNDELYHYGVKGMKWGVHRARNNVSTSSKRTKSNSTQQKDKATKTKKSSSKKNIAAKGARAAGKATAKIGQLYLVDQIFYNGTGTKIAKKAAVTAGRLAVTAVMKARGADYVRWYN